MIAVALILAPEIENIAPNTAKVTNMIEAGATWQRNMFSEIKLASNCNTKITYSV